MTDRTNQSKEKLPGAYREGYVKREFDCGHWILVFDHWDRHDICPHCPGEFVRETEPTESDFEEAEWT